MENNFKFYNTLTRQIDTVVPRVDGKIGMYTCGPTVYHFAHIGNIRSYIMEDVLEKALRYVGYDVKRGITAGGDRVPYARAHNEGFSGSVVVRSHERVSKKGKPYVVKQHTRKMLVPRRRFMGESHELETLIKKDVEQLFKNTMER